MLKQVNTVTAVAFFFLLNVFPFIAEHKNASNPFLILFSIVFPIHLQILQTSQEYK